MNDVSTAGLRTPGSDWAIYAQWDGNHKALCSFFFQFSLLKLNIENLVKNLGSVWDVLTSAGTLHPLFYWCKFTVTKIPLELPVYHKQRVVSWPLHPMIYISYLKQQ